MDCRKALLLFFLALPLALAQNPPTIYSPYPGTTGSTNPTWPATFGASLTDSDGDIATVTTYKIMKVSKVPAGVILVCEAPSTSNWDCTQPPEYPKYLSCTKGEFWTTTADGKFTDEWTMGKDSFTPIGCGFDITDVWYWREYDGTTSFTKPLGTLTGFVHNVNVKINGVVAPPDAMQSGTVIPK